MSSRSFRRSALLGAGLAAALAVGAGAVAHQSGGGPGGAPRLTVADPYIPLPATPGGMGAGYLTVRNAGGADTLLGVSSPAAGSVTMHRSTDTSMEQVDEMDVPAGGTLDLARGGAHLMIMDWAAQPALGDELELDLQFAKAGRVVVKVPVKPLTYRPGS
ncbi:copper chaperone PCu(A)C [Kitasatospora sp. NA04385]|uniref:copper chaperone PCu(A)C n=1 Tax=Kitasatospora sp. NA04385 TaxID=2742135 RepID=UPI001590F0FD|nr:copper chaperone PCu(A)C [Kitasatospora sp. NA04385]QKW20877.1 copper chaperone PCu(A)C [Kitasatospora sp. NA04385]